MSKSNYNAKDIQVLEGLDAVRLRPGMYIGTTGSKGLHHILWEIVDNSIDEAANGFASQIKVKIYADGSASVEDNGRGIPVDIHPKLGVSGVEVVFTQLHAGGKFNNDTYAFSGGLHGVGASVTNALSRWLKVEVYKSGKVYSQKFASIEEAGKIRSGVAQGSLTSAPYNDAKKSGTFVRFMPDDRVFDEETFQYEVIAKRLHELAFLNKGIKIELTSENSQEKKAEYCYEGGIVDFVKYLNDSKTTLHHDPIYIEQKNINFEVCVAIQYTDSYNESIFSYVNNIPTVEGGTHETGFKSGYTKVMNDFARARNILKDKDDNLLGEDYREGISVVLAVKMQNVQFEGQTKTKLGNPDAKAAVESIVVAGLTEYLYKKSNLSTGEKIVNKAIGAAKVREAAKKAKELTRQKNSLAPSNLVGKLASCTGRKAEINEIFIVEGNSAGGSAKQGRDKSFQAILPLRGKPLNAEKKRIDQILLNEEIRIVISALGAGFDDDFNINNLKYNKIIILSDADQDGAHIRAILLTFFFRYMKSLLTEGHIYMGMPPLYKITSKGKSVYAFDDKELQEILAKTGGSYNLQRYKGLGEMNPEQLWETTMNPMSRVLTQVAIDDAANAERLVSTLMGDNVEARKKYINEFANFNKIDNFISKIN